MFGHARTALLLYAVAMGYLEAAVVGVNPKAS